MSEKLLLLLVQTQADVDALPAAAQAILAAGFNGVWMIHSPAIAVDVKTAAAQFDKEIEDLRIAKRAAADRDDFIAADGHRQKIEEKLLDRAKVVNDAWKNMTPEDRAKVFAQRFAPVREAFQGRINAKFTCLQDHWEREQWVPMLNSLSGAWFAPFKPGSFVMAWPEAIPTGATKDAVTTVLERLPKIPKAEPKSTPTYTTREEELSHMRHFALMPICKKLGVDPKGKDRKTIIAEIVAAELKAATLAPELAEY